MNTNQGFNAQDLCSRKLWELVSDHDQQPIGKADLEAAIAELESRRHYLTELAGLRQSDYPRAE